MFKNIILQKVAKKMLKKFKGHACVFFVLFFHTAFTQTNISGKIVDEHNKPMPFVHIRLENINLGTISNENGLFKLVIGKGHEDKAIIISALGYQTQQVFLEEGDYVIQMTPDVTHLQEVTIKATDRGKELIKKAIEAIPKNYPLVEERHFGFFREVTHWNKQKEPIYIAETSIESIKKSYSKKQLSGDVKLVEVRKYKSTQLDSTNVRIYAGVHHIHRFDVVARREAFLQKLDRFKYKIVDTINRRDKNVYKIHFRNKEKISGYVYILDSTFAIIKAEFKQSSGFNHFLFSPENRKYLNYTVTYEQGKDSLWRFKQSNYKTAFKRKNKVLVLSSEYVTTNIEPNSKKMAYSDKFQYSDILLNKEKVYKPDFWNNYNIVLPNKEYEDLFKSMGHSLKTINDNHTQDEQLQGKSKKWIDILFRLRQEMSFTATSIGVASNRVTFGNTALNIQQSLNSSRENVYGISYSLLYELKPHFFIGYAGETKISKSGISSHNLSLIKCININPNRRPVFIVPGINLGYQEQKYFLGNFTASEDFNVNGKSFRSGKTAVFLSQRNVSFQPNLSLSVEKNHRFNVLFSMKYNIPLNKNSGLLLQEKEGFFLFRKNTFVKNGTENLIIEHSNDLLKNNIGVSAGIVYRL